MYIKGYFRQLSLTETTYQVFLRCGEKAMIPKEKKNEDLQKLANT